MRPTRTSRRLPRAADATARHIRVLQALELHGNRVDIVQQHLVAVRVSAVHRTGKVEFRLVGVERAHGSLLLLS